jgi:hypothetical protein
MLFKNYGRQSENYWTSALHRPPNMEKVELRSAVSGSVAQKSLSGSAYGISVPGISIHVGMKK